MTKGDIEGSIIYRDRASRELDKVAGSADKAGRKFGGLAKAGSVFGIVAGAAVVKFGKDSVKAFTEAQDSQAKLDQAFKKFPKTNDVNIGSLRKLNSEMARKTKFDDDALASGQAVLAQFNLSGKQIEQVTPLLADYAEKTGQDLPTAASLLGKALLGNAKALKAVGIQMPSAKAGADALAKAEDDVAKAEKKLADARKKGDPKKVAEATDGLAKAHRRLSTAQEGAAFTGDTFGRLMDGLKEKVGGTAETMGGTAAGKAAILKNQFGELQETAGQKLVPVLLKVADVGLKVVDFVSRNGQVIGPLVAATTALVVVSVAWNKAMMVGSAAKVAFIALTQGQAAATAFAAESQVGLNVALLANPIGLVVIAIAALAAGIIYLATKTHFFQTAWHGITAAFSATFNWVKGHWPLLLAILTGPIGLAVLFITRKWDGIVGFVSKLPGRIAGAATGLWDGIKIAFKSAINWIVDKWNGLEFKLPSVNTHIPGVGKVGGFTLGTPDIPRLASGGIVPARPGGTLALLGEGGRDEAVIPLSRGGRRSAGSPIIVHLTVQGFVGSETALVQKLEGAFRDLQRSRQLAFLKPA